MNREPGLLAGLIDDGRPLLSLTGLALLLSGLFAVFPHPRRRASAGFGGGLLTIGILVWHVARYAPATRALLQVLAVAGTAGFGCAVGVHYVEGYTDATHLAPAWAGVLLFGMSLGLIWRASVARVVTVTGGLGLLALTMHPVVDAAEPPQPALAQSRQLICAGSLSAAASADGLAAAFGASNVTHEDLKFPEGETMPGTVLFANRPSDRLEILWKDSEARRGPEAVMVRMWDIDGRSHWRSPTGVTLGLDLQRVEALNGRPFQLLGFAWDYEGGVMSWADGRLAGDQPGDCRLSVRFTLGDIGPNAARQRWFEDASGDKEFSSSHPAMQGLRPVVREVVLSYP